MPFVIVTSDYCDEPAVQFVEDSDFDDPLTRPFEYISFEACDAYSE